MSKDIDLSVELSQGIDVIDLSWPMDDNMDHDFANSMSDTITITAAAAQPTVNIASDTFIFSDFPDYTSINDRLAKLEAAILEEKQLRDQHPALKQAYDEYRLLLVLAKQHTPDVLTDN